MKPKTAKDVLDGGLEKTFDELSSEQQGALLARLVERRKDSDTGRQPRSKGHNDGERSGGADAWD